MASKQTYECYICKKNGFSNVRVYLDSKTEDGKTIYKDENMQPHTHKQKQQTNTSSNTVTTRSHLLIQVHHIANDNKLLNCQMSILEAKIDRMVEVLGQRQQEAQWR